MNSHPKVATLPRLFALVSAFLCVQASLRPLSGAVPGTAGPALREWHGSWGWDGDAYAEAIRDPQQWQRLWEHLQKKPPCALDPSAAMAVFIAIGQRPTGGFGVEIVSASPADGHLVVTYRESRPPPHAYVTEALTHPWVVALLPRSELPVVFKAAESHG